MKVIQERIDGIIFELDTAIEGYSLSEADQYLADLSGLDLRKELLKRKTTNPNSTPLIAVVCQYHEKLRKDRNSHYALTDVLTKRALEKAKQLEAKITPENAEDYPLYGFVLSLKESIKMKGYMSTLGMVCHMITCKTETPFIDYLERKGAVILSRGNVPQMLFAMESWNNIYGAVSNPWNKDRTAGGSTGGDAALIALGHVNGGFGSDAAGSLRIPALFCGVYAISMTSQRINLSAHAMFLEGLDAFSKLPDSQYQFRGNIGPMARCVDDLYVLTKVLVENYKDQPRIPPVPWKINLPPVKKVGILVEWDNIFELTEVNRRAIKMARSSLTRAGIETVEIDMRPYIRDLVQTVGSLFYQNRALKVAMTGKVDLKEPVLPVYKMFRLMMILPTSARQIMRYTMRDNKSKIFLEAFHQSQYYNSQYFGRKLNGYKQMLVEQMKEAGVETIVCPGMMPAIPKYTSNRTNIWAMYMFIFNGLKFPSGALPITRVQKDEQFYKSKFNFDFEKAIQQATEGSEGLPVGVQVASTSWNEEKILQLMKIIETDVKFK